MTLHSIDTAPRDGSLILAWENEEPYIAYWLLAPDNLGGWHEARDTKAISPSHWLPLLAFLP